MDNKILNIACVCSEIKAADIEYNRRKIIEALDTVTAENLYQVAIFPELCLTGSFCGDLFLNADFQEQCLLALESIRAWSQGKELIIVFGSPLYLKEKIYNCAFVLANGHYLGIVPKSKLNFRGPDRVYRGFSSLNFDNISEIALDAQNIPFGQPLLFSSKQQKLSFAVEIGTDAGSGLALKLAASGAQLVFNLAAIRKTVSSLLAWQDLMCVQSRQAQIAYLLQSGSPGDSTAESVLSDMSLGFIFGQRLRADKVCYDSFKVDSFSIDLDLLYARRTMMSDSLPSTEKEVRHITIVIKSAADYALKPEYSREPFLENLPLDYVCGRIFEIQSEALIKKLCSFPKEKIVIGLSGGQDSAAALLSVYATYKKYGLDTGNILAVLLPGPGSSKNSYNNALELINSLHLPYLSIDINDAIQKNLKQMGHAEACYDRAYQQTQSRERTRILMDLATDRNALFVGTLTLSEIALGWMSFSGDQISMYGINCGIPKSVIPHICSYQASCMPNTVHAVICSILRSPISPELLPLDSEGCQQQKTEDSLGPYLVHDFFLYYLLKYNLKLSKIYEMACAAFKDDYDTLQISTWLNIFRKRFFTRNYKRACIPEGPQVFGISLSNSMLWEMPGDLEGSIWSCQ